MSEFFRYWRPALSCPAPLLEDVPGYGAEMSYHPDLVAAGSMCYIFPHWVIRHREALTSRSSTMANGRFRRIAILSGGEKGYREWPTNCANAICWAEEQTEVGRERVSFFGTSQCGGGALLLAPLFRGRGVRCVAADVPFLADFRGARSQGAYALFSDVLQIADDREAAWHAVGLIDTLSHVLRLDLPELLTAGAATKRVHHSLSKLSSNVSQEHVHIPT